MVQNVSVISNSFKHIKSLHLREKKNNAVFKRHCLISRSRHVAIKPLVQTQPVQSKTTTAIKPSIAMNNVEREAEMRLLSLFPSAGGGIRGMQ